MAFTADNFLSAFQRLLPRGRAWNNDPSSNQTRVWRALVGTWVRQSARAEQLLADAFPATTNELLPEWEETLGLPDPCAGPAPTPDARRRQVVARFVGIGGQSIPYYVAYAANLGYDITITEFSPFLMGVNAMGDLLAGDVAAITWLVTAPAVTVHLFQMGVSVMGDPLGSFGNEVLQCALKEVAPLHTDVYFAFR